MLEENDVVVIEGAGSPAEINLQASDYVNLRTALAARAACLLVNDASGGGAVAHLYGTHQLLPHDVCALLRGLVLNRCHGDLARHAPGAAQLQALTGVPTLAALPMWAGHGLPEEDGVFDDAPSGGDRGLRIAVIAYPRISNLDEFQPLKNVPGVHLLWARTPADLYGGRLDRVAGLQAHEQRSGLAACARAGSRGRGPCGTGRRSARHLRRAADGWARTCSIRTASTATRRA